MGFPFMVDMGVLEGVYSKGIYRVQDLGLPTIRDTCLGGCRDKGCSILGSMRKPPRPRRERKAKRKNNTISHYLRRASPP